MALKLKISKEEFDKLPDDIKAEYAEKDGSYVLDVTGIEDTGALRRAKDREAQQRKDAEKALREAQAELDKLTEGDARKKGDIETLEKAWQGKLDSQKNEYESKLSQRESFIKSNLVDSVAERLAAKISTSPALLMPHIKGRLVADLDGDKPVTKVLDANGKVSDMTLEALETEFVGNKDYAAIIKGNNASGGGASKKGASGGGATFNTDKGNDDLTKLNPREMVAYIAEKKANSND